MQEKLIEKIQKLIKLSDSPNENEAKLAMSKAQELMLKHNIDMRSVKDHDSEYVNQTSDTFKRENPTMKYIHPIITEFFFVRIVKSCRKGTSYFNYVGEKQNVDTAIHTINFLKETFERLWKDYKKESGAATRSKGSFMYGLKQGIETKLLEQRQSTEKETGLVLVNDPRADQKVNELFSRLSKGRRSAANLSDTKAMHAGNRAAKNVNFSSGSLK